MCEEKKYFVVTLTPTSDINEAALKKYIEMMDIILDDLEEYEYLKDIELIRHVPNDHRFNVWFKGKDYFRSGNTFGFAINYEDIAERELLMIITKAKKASSVKEQLYFAMVPYLDEDLTSINGLYNGISKAKQIKGKVI